MTAALRAGDAGITGASRSLVETMQASAGKRAIVTARQAAVDAATRLFDALQEISD